VECQSVNASSRCRLPPRALKSAFTPRLATAIGEHDGALPWCIIKCILQGIGDRNRDGSEPDSPFARDANNKLVRRSYWLDMNDRSLVMVMTQGLGAHLTNDEKRAHLTDVKREHLIDQVCIQEILPPEKT
jgi:hypothetical protein